MAVWPYSVLQRDDDGISDDLRNIVDHFDRIGYAYDLIIFIPEAGRYLWEMFKGSVDSDVEVAFVTVRRASTTASSHWLKDAVFKRRVLSDVMRHVEVLVRLTKRRFGLKQKMVADLDIDFDPGGRRVLVIDDSVDTGTTMQMVKALLLAKGAHSVKTACISNHLVPDKTHVDYAVYRYKLLRTRNSRDYHAI